MDLQKRIRELEKRDSDSLNRNLDALELIVKLRRQVIELTSTLNGVVQDAMYNGTHYLSNSFVISDYEGSGCDLMQWLDEYRFEENKLIVAHVNLVFHDEV